jgi:anhydro-N-acetylmuramic acid kinase
MKFCSEGNPELQLTETKGVYKRKKTLRIKTSSTTASDSFIPTKSPVRKDRGEIVPNPLQPEIGHGLPPDLATDTRHSKLVGLVTGRLGIGNEGGMIGLSVMSGTSLNDIYVLLAFYEDIELRRTKIMKYWAKAYPIPQDIKRRVIALQHGNRKMKPRDVLKERNALNEAMTVLFSEALNAAIKEIETGLIGFTKEDIHFIGFAGQTFRYDPEPLRVRLRADWIDKDVTVRSIDTLGNPADLRDSTGIPVVGKIRESDMTRRVGGRGAPLSAYYDFLMFWDRYKSRILLNIGGIANFTYIRSGSQAKDLLSFDTGSGNMVINFVVRRVTEHWPEPLEYDVDGKLAAAGKVLKPLLAKCKRHPYFRRKPPMTTGAEDFGEHFVKKMFFDPKYRRAKPEDLVATATAFVAWSIVRALRFVEGPIHEFITYGGGADNPTLMTWLKEAVAKDRVKRNYPKPTFPALAEVDPDSGIGPQDKEAATIGAIAFKRLKGQPTTTPATGALEAGLLGALWS